ncbi:MAG TPA: hypothetical protein VN635_12470 [Conexibacter sp.]|nr:hypothetical protein [Conexibacter sp.]
MICSRQARRGRGTVGLLLGVLVLAVAALGPGAGVAHAEANTCNTLPPREATTWNGYHVIYGAGNIEGTPADDFIVGGAGNDVIHAGYGNDVVCAGEGDDAIYGGGGSDDLHGQGGNDSIFGELLDDELWGEAGRDLLVGGHGVDTMHGGEGNDWLRGGTNGDTFDGGTNSNDNDVASFADATPSGAHVGSFDGVAVNLTEATTADGIAPHTAVGTGTDTVTNVESVIGSPFDDEIVAPSGVANQHLYGGMGSDTCTPGSCIEPARSLTAPFAYLDSYSPFATTPTPDPALLVVGGAAGETFGFSNTGSSFTVTASAGGLAEELATTEACTTPSAGTVTCALSATPTGGAISWFGGEGDDTATVANAAPNGVTTDLDGGDGSDTITGSAGSENLYSGNAGSDVLRGGDGSDALIAEGTGGDFLYGEGGNDQLVTTDPCQGHVFSGGSGTDIAGFARTVPAGVWGISATLGDPAGNAEELGSSFYGAAYLLGEGGSGNACPGGVQSYVGGDDEILEGTIKNDLLVGNEAADTIWGRDGDDRIWGMGGDDAIEGHPGDDTIYGGTGNDTINGNDGNDTLEGNSGTDTVNGGEGNDLLHGNAGEDTLSGGPGADTVWGDEGVDSLFGNAGSDKLRARDGTRDTTVNCGEGVDEPTEKDSFDPLVGCE